MKTDHSLQANRAGIDSMYLDEVIKLPEKIDHVKTLISIAKLGFKPVRVSTKIFSFRTTWRVKSTMQVVFKQYFCV